MITNAATGNRQRQGAGIRRRVCAGARARACSVWIRRSPGRPWEQARRRCSTSYRSLVPRKVTPSSTSSLRCSSTRSRTGSPRRSALFSPPLSRRSSTAQSRRPPGTPAWKTIPSWYVLGTIDKAIPPSIQLFMARRIHAHITRVRAGPSVDGRRSRSGREGDHGRGEGNELRPVLVSRSNESASVRPAHGNANRRKRP